MTFPFGELPIVQAPMSGATTPELVAAACNAGCLGSLPVGYVEAAKIGELIARVRAATTRPFAVNLFVDTSSPASAEELRRANDKLCRYRDELGIPHPENPPTVRLDFREQFDAILQTRPAVFSFTFGIPSSDILDDARSAGIYMIGTAKTVAEARALEDAGVDAVTVQGYEAGGHHGPFLTPIEDSNFGTIALVPQVVDAVKIPVLAAGGIGDGRAVAAVLNLGAAAAAVGSAFLLADESAIPRAYRRALQSADAHRTTLTRVFSGRTARGIRNRFIDEMTSESEIAPYPHQHWLTRDIRNAAAQQDRAEFLSLWTGQAAPLAKALPTAAIIDSLMNEARDAAERTSSALARRAVRSG